jgi:hypothetical protein
MSVVARPRRSLIIHPLDIVANYLGKSVGRSVDNAALSTERHRCHLDAGDPGGYRARRRIRHTLRRRWISPIHSTYYDYYFLHQPIMGEAQL